MLRVLSQRTQFLRNSDLFICETEYTFVKFGVRERPRLSSFDAQQFKKKSLNKEWSHTPIHTQLSLWQLWLLQYDKHDIFSCPELRKGADTITPEKKGLWQPWFGQPWCVLDETCMLDWARLAWCNMHAWLGKTGLMKLACLTGQDRLDETCMLDWARPAWWNLHAWLGKTGLMQHACLTGQDRLDETFMLDWVRPAWLWATLLPFPNFLKLCFC